MAQDDLDLEFDQDVTGEKLRQMLWNFEYTLPFDEAKRKGYVFHNMQFDTFMNEVIKTIKENYKIHPLAMGGYIRFLKEMCEYILEETDQWPDQEFNDPNQIIVEYMIQTNQHGKKKTPIVELEVKNGRIRCLKNAK